MNQLNILVLCDTKNNIKTIEGMMDARLIKYKIVHYKNKLNNYNNWDMLIINEKRIETDFPVVEKVSTESPACQVVVLSELNNHTYKSEDFIFADEFTLVVDMAECLYNIKMRSKRLQCKIDILEEKAEELKSLFTLTV
jgi:hypothetical protein